MSRRTAWLLAALALALCGLLVHYLVGIAEPYEEIVDLGPAPEVRGNPFLAAEHFLATRSKAPRRADTLDLPGHVPAAGQTLLMLGNRSQMTPRQADQALAWAARGGHLLFIAEALWDEEKGRSGDLLLDKLGIQQYSSDELPEADADAGQQPAVEDPYPHLTRLYLENEQAPAYFAFDTDLHLYDAQDRAHVWANSGGATHILQLYHGDGLVTVLSDPDIWNNDAIGEHDHAWLLWYLTQGTEVTLLYRTESDNLGALLLRHFPQALLALALLGLLLLWRQGMRQGPVQQPRPLARRQLHEHLRASAECALRHGGQRRLLQALQQDIQRRARKRHPGFERLAVAEQWQMLARLSGQPTRAIGQAMRPPADKRLSAALFTDQVAYLQTLRNAL